MTTMYDPMTIWMVLAAIGIGTYALRLSFILLLGRLDEVPPRIVGVLRFVPAAVLAALVLPAILALTVTPSVAIEADWMKVVAGTIAAFIAWRTENVLATIGVGMAALWCLQVLV